MLRWISMRLPAEHVWPPFWTMAFTSTGIAASKSASSKTIWGDLPPSSSVQPMWFFAAAMPDGQVARGTTRETVHEMWGRPVDLVARERAGTLALMPPTIVNLTQLARFEQTADVLTERPSLALVEPKLEQTADGWVLRSSIP